MALTNFGKVVLTTFGLGVATVFITAAAPAFAGNLTQAEPVIAAAETHPVPKLNLLLLPESPDPGTKIG